MSTRWDPSFPEFARPSGGGLADRPDDAGAEPWTAAPADSHVEKFRYWDARRHPFLRKFGTGSELHVRFRAAKGKPATEYTYFFADPDRGAAAFEQMKAAASPGEVVSGVLVAGRVPYRRTA